MTTNFQISTIDDFDEKFTPIKNHLVKDAAFEGCLFETYGTEVKHVSSQPDNRVWTWVDGDDGTYLVQGMAYVNRIGYLITEEEYQVGDPQEYQVDQYCEEDDED